MADKLELDIKIETASAANSIKDLRSSLKALIDEQANVEAGSESWKRLTESINDTEGKIGDLTDSFSTMTGSGIDRTRTSIGLLKDGFSNLDFGKVGIALKGLGAAFKAVPIFLLVEGIRYLNEHFDELSKGSGFLGKALRFIGDIISGLTDAFTDLADSMGIINKQIDEMSEAIDNLGKTSKDILSSQINEIDRLIAKTKASGESTVAYENLKQEAIIRTNKLVVEQMIAFVRAGGELSDEQKKTLTESLENIKNAKNQQEVIEITAEKEKNEKLKAEREKHKAEIDRINAEEADAWWAARLKEIEDEKAYLAEIQRLKEEAARQAREADAMNQEIDNAEAMAKAELRVLKNQEDIDAQIALLTTKRDIELQNQLLTNDQKKVIEQQYQNDVLKIKEDSIAKEKQLESQKQQAVFDIAKASTDSLQSLSDLYFTVKRANLKKGSKEDLEQAKKQFNINKALAITSATISGIQGVVNALSAQSVVPEPFGTVLKVATAVGVGLAAAANIAKISASKFDESGGGGGGGASAVTSVPVPAPPTISNPDANVSGTKFDESGKKIEDTKQQPIQVNVKAQVVETEMTEKQTAVSTIKDKSTF